MLGSRIHVRFTLITTTEPFLFFNATPLSRLGSLVAMKTEVLLEQCSEHDVGDTDSAPLLQPPSIALAKKVNEIGDEESNNSSAASCRICLELEGSDPADELIAPCLCKGTQQFVHRSCLDHWRFGEEGFAFSHCTTCKAEFHLRAEVPEDYSLCKLKFRIFVARDVLLVFLAVQTMIAVMGGIAYLMDTNGRFKNSFSNGWDRLLSKHLSPLNDGPLSDKKKVNLLELLSRNFSAVPATPADSNVSLTE